MKWILWKYHSYEGWWPTVFDTEALKVLNNPLPPHPVGGENHG